MVSTPNVSAFDFECNLCTHLHPACSLLVDSVNRLSSTLCQAVIAPCWFSHCNNWTMNLIQLVHMLWLIRLSHLVWIIHTCDPPHVGGWGRRTMSSKPAWIIKQYPVLINPNQNKNYPHNCKHRKQTKIIIYIILVLSGKKKKWSHFKRHQKHLFF